MRFHDIKEGVGRIVKGVNTTSDVGTNAIKKQAAKFGNKVDKDGRPPTLSKKVKGSKTNVLFNLGMSENKYSPMEMAIMEGGHSLDDAKVLVDNTDESMLQYNMLEAKIGELAAASEIYVDMDGVLADFFGEWAKLMKVDHYSKIDGIDINVALQKIRDTDEFWLNLPMLPQAKQLLGLIKKVKGSYNICSSPLADDPNSEPHKREWIKRNLDFFPPNKVIITHNKPKYAKKEDGTPNILIDDFGKNIASWEAAGGIGFKYKDHKFERTAKAIQKYMKEPVAEKAVSKKQQQFFGIVRAMQKGDMPKGGEAGKVAKDMKKSDVKDYASTKHKGLPTKKKKTESYTRDQLPQITKKELKYIPHEIITVPVNSIIPVQKERLKENYTKQLKKIAVGKYNPIVVDIENKIINGHHRYDIVKMLQMESISVAKLPYTLEFLIELTRRGFMKGAGAALAFSAVPGAVKAMSNEGGELIVKTSTGKEFDITNFPGSLKEKIKAFEEKIKKVYSKHKNVAVPDFKFYLDGKYIGQIKHTGNIYKETKEAPSGHYFTKGGNLVKGKLTKDAKERGARETDPKDKSRSKVPKVSQYNENFADGKKKGKSRPGRVKKSGASCNGSVTSLRSKAKKASGERAKMYHWCANMKSGKKKK